MNVRKQDQSAGVYPVTGKPHKLKPPVAQPVSRWFTLGCYGCGWRASVHITELPDYNPPLSCPTAPGATSYKDPAR